MTGTEVEPYVVEGEILDKLQVRDRPRGLSHVQLHLVDSFDEAWEFSQWMDGRDTIAVDTETTGLVTGVDTVRLVQVGGLDEGWAIPWHRWSGLFEDMLGRFVRDKRNRVTMHNAKFDAGMLAHMGVQVPRDQIDDTMVMAHILEPNMSTGLKPQASRYVDAAAASAQVSLDVAINGRGGWTWATVPVDYGPYWQYAALDTVLTAHLAAHHQPLVKPFQKAYDLEMAATWVYEKMERHGALIDRDYAVEHMGVFEQFVEEAGAWVKDNYGVSAGSNQAIIKILADAGHVFSKLTESGALALDKEVLEDIDHPLAATVLKRRQLQKLASTYLKHFIEDVDAEGFIHPDIRGLGARTGRNSISRPSLQNLPRKSEANRAAEIVRNCVVSQDRHTLLMCDLDQIEMRLLAHLSGDPGLQAAFRQPDDFFAVLAREVYQDPTIQKADDRRRGIKNFGYAQIYGAGIAKMAKMSGVPTSHIQAIKVGWDGRYGGVKSWQKAVESKAWQRQRDEGVPYAVSSLTGRHHVADPNKIYALVNYLIQGTAAESFKMKLLELDAAGLGDYMVVPVHDEIVLDVPDESVSDAVQTLRRIMNDDEMFSVPMSASVSAGQRWGMKEELG